MKKTYKIDVDCANCANKMEDAANKTVSLPSRLSSPSRWSTRREGDGTEEGKGVCKHE